MGNPLLLALPGLPLLLVGSSWSSWCFPVGVASPPTLFVSDKMAETSGPGEPMEVEEEVERVAQNGGAGAGAGVGVGVGGTNGGLMESSGPAAAPLLPPPPPPSNPVQNPQPQLSITPVSRSSVVSLSCSSLSF